MMDFGKSIKEYREKQFLTQERLAKILGVSNVTISRWETGSFEPNMAMKKKLCALFEEAGLRLG